MALKSETNTNGLWQIQYDNVIRVELTRLEVEGAFGAMIVSKKNALRCKITYFFLDHKKFQFPESGRSSRARAADHNF